MGWFGRDSGDELRRLAALEAALARLEDKVDFLYRSLEMSYATPEEREPSYLSEIRALLGRGLKIEAIKVYRAHTQLGLKEAKDAVEEIERTLPRR